MIMRGTNYIMDSLGIKSIERNVGIYEAEILKRVTKILSLNLKSARLYLSYLNSFYRLWPKRPYLSLVTESINF